MFTHLKLSEPISVGMTSSSFCQLSPEIIIGTSWRQPPVLVAESTRVPSASQPARRDDGGRLRERFVMRQKRRAGAEIEWNDPRGRTFTASSIWSPLAPSSPEKPPSAGGAFRRWQDFTRTHPLCNKSCTDVPWQLQLGLSARGNHSFGLLP